MNYKLVAIVLCLTACAKNYDASQAQLKRELARYEGGPVDAMIARFGTPSQQTDVGGQRWYIWTGSEESFALGYYMGYENDSSYEARCKVSAQVQDGVVRQVRREGNLKDCEWLELL